MHGQISLGNSDQNKVKNCESFKYLKKEIYNKHICTKSMKQIITLLETKVKNFSLGSSFMPRKTDVNHLLWTLLCFLFVCFLMKIFYLPDSRMSIIHPGFSLILHFWFSASSICLCIRETEPTGGIFNQ